MPSTEEAEQVHKGRGGCLGGSPHVVLEGRIHPFRVRRSEAQAGDQMCQETTGAV